MGRHRGACARLLTALEERSAFPAGEWGAGAQVCAVIPLWLADLDVGSLAPSIRHIADQLGHARPSTPLDHYLGRRAITTADFAEALTDFTQLE